MDAAPVVDAVAPVADAVPAPVAEVAAPVAAAPALAAARKLSSLRNRPAPVPEPVAVALVAAAVDPVVAPPVVAPPVVAAPPPAVEPPEIETLRAALAESVAASLAKDVIHTIERAGITDPDGIETARHLYEKAKAPEGGEKPTLAEWLASDALPKAVRAYLPDAPVAPIVGAPIVAPVVLPASEAGARPPPSGAQYSAPAILSMMGRPDVYAANREAIMRAIGGK